MRHLRSRQQLSVCCMCKCDIVVHVHASKLCIVSRAIFNVVLNVSACRDRPDMELVPEDPYANKEFYVKWRHWSHIHCSWDTRETLFQLAGYKRVKNYIKRMEDLDRRRRVLSREEIELIDVERQMEYEMSLQHQVVRIVLLQCLQSYWVAAQAAHAIRFTISSS